MGCVKVSKTISIPATVKISANGKIGTYKVTSIEAMALKGNTKLKKLTIGKNVEKIGKKAFSNCKKLKSIIIQTKKLTKKKVGTKAFEKIAKKACIQVPKKQKKAYKKLLYAKGVTKKMVIK